MVFKIFMNVAVQISNGNVIDGQRAKVTLNQGTTVGSQFLSQKILDINLGMKIIVLIVILSCAHSKIHLENIFTF